MRALGLDLGSKRVGVAVSDSDGRVATPVGTVARTGDRVAEHRHVAELVAEWDAEIVVVGLPLSLDGTTGPAARAALAEIEQLRAALDVPVVSHDERLTTVTAHDRLREQGVKGRRRTAVVDQTAAAVLLQAWLERPDHQEPHDP
jgi:putative Holliday junction resolvase